MRQDFYDLLEGMRRYRMAVLDLLPPASPVLLERMPRLCLSGW